MLRTIELPEGNLDVEDFSDLNDEAGAVIWDAALVLIHYLSRWSTVENPPSADVVQLAGLHVLELGSGSGVAGMAAALLGAASVTLTDVERLVPGIKHNVQANQLSERVRVMPLEWGNLLHTQRALVGHLEGYDAIIASEVVYDMSALDDLLMTLALLSGPHTKILLAHEAREETEGWLEAAHRHGLKETLVPADKLDEVWSSPDIVLYVLRKVQG